MPSESPVFIIGSPRSGTTMLRLMLAAHPDLVVPPECGFVIWWLPKYRAWTAADTTTRLDAFLADLVSSRKFETWNLDPATIREAALAAPPNSYATLVSRVYLSYARSIAKPVQRWGDKNNFHVHHIPELADLFPEARFIHIVRDGRDVACSYRELASLRSPSPYAPRLPSATPEIATEWAANVSRAADALAVLSAHRTTTVFYEDLARDPEPQLHRLCAFLGLPFSQDMLRFGELNRERSLEPAEFMAWKRKTSGAADPSGIGRFRRELATSDIAAFETVARAALERFGYT